MTVKRIWHGWTAPDKADAYQKLLQEEVSVGIEAMDIKGLRRFEMMRRDAGDEVEFVTIMEFDDLTPSGLSSETTTSGATCRPPRGPF